MATENNSPKSVQDFLAESDRLIKASERGLKKLDAIRQQLGLQPGASKDFLAAIPESDEAKAQQELKNFFAEGEIDTAAVPKKKRKKKRNKLNKAMRKNLRI